ncbi:MAG: M48 family metalloprotease [Deltaproteobacteria bacterium]|nr:M48 family metalloprotease [Deltaproteobacteria bacterium]
MKYKKRYIIIFMLLLFQFFVSFKFGYCLTIKEEEEMGEEFLKHIKKSVTFIENPLILNYIKKVGDKISSNIDSKPFDFNFYIIKNSGYNAFAAPGGHIFLNSGLFEAMDTEEELAGILSHEIAHVTCRHISQRLIKQTKIQLATLAGLAAGILLGSTGDSEAAAAIMQGTAAAGASAALAYSREDERQADQIGLKYLENSGYTSGGLISSLKKIREKQWFTPDKVPTYLMTHPGIDERIIYLSSAIKDTKPVSDIKNNDFEMANIGIKAIYGNKTQAEKEISIKLQKNPNSPAANYGYAIILERSGKKKDAAAYFKKALAQKPFDPYILKKYGILLFDMGSYREADKIIENVNSIIPEDPDGLFYMGRLKLILNNAEQGIDILKKLTGKHPEYKQAHYYLAKGYTEIGNIADSHYNLGIHSKNQKNKKNAEFHFKKALEAEKDTDKKKNIEKMIESLNPPPTMIIRP